MGNTRSREACEKIGTGNSRLVAVGASSDEKCYFLALDSMSSLFKRQSSIDRTEGNSKSRYACEKLGNANDPPVTIIPSDETFIDGEKCHFLQSYHVVPALFKPQSSFGKTEGNGKPREACPKFGNTKDQQARIIPSAEVFIPGGRCYILPYEAMSTLFKRQCIDKTDFAELLFPFAGIYSSSANIHPIRSKRRARRNRRRRKCSTAVLTKGFQDAMPEEGEQKLQKRRHDAEDTAPPHGYTLAERIKSSSKSELPKPQEFASDEEEVGKHQPEVAMLIDSVRAFILSRQQPMRARRRMNMIGKRTRWVPKLQTLQEMSP